MTTPTMTARMTISLPGVLNRAAEQCQRSRDNKHLQWPLEKLLSDLRELRDRYKAGDTAVVDEFFALWSDREREAVKA